MSDIGARFVACRRWRWMPGMHWRRDFAGGQSLGDRTGMILNEWDAVDGGGRIFRIGVLEGMEPAPEDPATLGCILALVREAWGSPTMHLTRFYTNVRDPSGLFSISAVWWRFVDGDEPEPILVETEDRRRYLGGATEAAALLAALEASP